MKNIMKKILELLNHYQIPGFRSRYMWKSIIATIGYFLIIVFSLGTMSVYSFWYGLTWFIAFIGIVFIFFNYRGILDKISKIKLKNYIAATIASLFIVGIVSAMAPPQRNPINENTKGVLTTQQPEVKGEQIKTETKEEKVIEDISYTTKETDDNTIKKGETKLKQEGKNGKREKVYKVTYENDKETKRELVSENITKEPVEKIVLIGTYEEKVESATQTTDNQTGDNNSNKSGQGYTNVDGNHVDSPSDNPAGATARCQDGNYSYSQHRQGTCSGHGGVAEWLN